MDQWIREQQYKNKGICGMKLLETRRSASQINRKQQRNILLEKFRNIPENMSPINSPLVSKTKEVQEEKANTKKTVGNSKRLEMLKKWKEEREKKKIEAKRQTKPVFKVYHVEHKDTLDKNYENIKGKKSIKTKENAPIKSFVKNEISENGTGRKVPSGRSENTKISRSTSKKPNAESFSSSTNQKSKTNLGKKQENKTKVQIGQKSLNNKIISNNQQKSPKKKSDSKLPDQVSVDDKKLIKREQLSALKKSKIKNKKLNSPQSKPMVENKDQVSDDLNSSSSEQKKLYQENSSDMNGQEEKDKSIIKRRSCRKSKVEPLQDEETNIPEGNYDSTTVGQDKTKCESWKVETDSEGEEKSMKVQELKKNINKTELIQEDSSELSFSIDRSTRQQDEKKTPRKSTRFANNDDNQKELMSSNTSQRKKKHPETPFRKSSKKSMGDNSADTNVDAFSTPQKEPEEICYISPFVTVSRGKTAARKEFQQRKSLNGSMFNTSVSELRSPKAAAGYFTHKLNKEIARIQDLCNTWQKYKDDGNLSEDACGVIDMTIGQSNLLISKKFNQFRSLIERCLANDELDMKIECEDLHGFWDMMYKQVSDVDKRFENLEYMKQNNWLEEAPKIKTPKVAVKGKKKGKAKTNSKASSMLKETILAARRNREKQAKSEGDIEILIVGKERTPRRKSTVSSTPGKGILKSSNVKSEKRKTVVFHNLRESLGSATKSPVSPQINRTPVQTRRSARLSLNRSKLVFE